MCIAFQTWSNSTHFINISQRGTAEVGLLLYLASCVIQYHNNQCVCENINIIVMTHYSVTITMLNSKVRQETNHGLLIGTMTFDLGWPWTVLVQGH